MTKYIKLGIFLLVPFLTALTVTDVVTPGRTVNGNVVSDRDEDGESPVFGDIQNSGNGNVDLTWSQVTVDTAGNPITVLLYELRYKLTGDTEYTLVTVPPNFVGHSLQLSAGDYEADVVAVGTNGKLSATSTITFTVN